MSKLNVALMIGAVVLVAGASDAQAAQVHLSLFDLFGMGTPHVLVTDPGRHAPVLDFGDQGNGNKKVYLAPKVGPDNSRPIEVYSTTYVDINCDWSKNNADNSDSGDWQQTTQAQYTPLWTMTTVTNYIP